MCAHLLAIVDSVGDCRPCWRLLIGSVRSAQSPDYNDDGNKLRRWFRQALGSLKAARHGESEGIHLMPNPEQPRNWERLEGHRTQMRKYFDDTFWSRGQRTGRLVYVCFCGAAVVAMSRLVEVARRKGQTCRGMHVVALPWGDPIPLAQHSRKQAVAEYTHMFEEYSKLFYMNGTVSQNAQNDAQDAPREGGGGGAGK